MSLIFVWGSMGSIWAIDVAIESLGLIQFTRDFMFDGVLFYHIFMYLLVSMCFLYPAYVICAFDEKDEG